MPLTFKLVESQLRLSNELNNFFDKQRVPDNDFVEFTLFKKFLHVEGHKTDSASAYRARPIFEKLDVHINYCPIFIINTL